MADTAKKVLKIMDPTLLDYWASWDPQQAVKDTKKIMAIPSGFYQEGTKLKDTEALVLRIAAKGRWEFVPWVPTYDGRALLQQYVAFSNVHAIMVKAYHAWKKGQDQSQPDRKLNPTLPGEINGVAACAAAKLARYGNADSLYADADSNPTLELMAAYYDAAIPDEEVSRLVKTADLLTVAEVYFTVTKNSAARERDEAKHNLNRLTRERDEAKHNLNRLTRERDEAKHNLNSLARNHSRLKAQYELVTKGFREDLTRKRKLFHLMDLT
jgi:hypothetical protein